VGYGELFATQVQGFGTCLSNVTHAILVLSRCSFRPVVSTAFPAATRIIISFVGARSNSLLSDLETLAVITHCMPESPSAIWRSIGALVDSIPSASFVRFTLLLKYPERSWLEQLDWLSFADALQRLHQELSPRTRKVVRVAILGFQLWGTGRVTGAADLVPLVQSALQCIRGYADVEVVGGVLGDFRGPYGVSPVPHFPMVV
jgi:hypothetical protein